MQFAAFGVAAFEWPRADVVTRTAAVVARDVLKLWIARNVKRAREVVPAWAEARWALLGLQPEAILGHLQTAMQQGREHLLRGDYRAAVTVLESQLPAINGNRVSAA